MELHRSSNANEFLNRSESWLVQSEAENNLMLGIARWLSDQPSDDGSENYWATVSEDGRVVGAAFRTPPYPLAVAMLPLEAVPLLVTDVRATYSELPGVSGPTAVAEEFANLWIDRAGGSWRVDLRQRIHALTAVNELATSVPGRLRRMEPSDAPLILEWMQGFVRETGVPGDAERAARPHLEKRNFYLWDDNAPRSVAAVLRDSPHGACVSAVYTPPIHRRKGYATAVVAALSERLLSSGKDFCCLYTDLANPTSNSIYAKIGYEPIRDDVRVVFEPA